MRNKKIWMFNHYAITPDLPGGTRHYDFAQELRKRGNDVLIFTSSFIHLLMKESKAYNGSSYILESYQGVNFVWLKTVAYSRNNGKRIANMLSYSMKVFKALKENNFEKPNFIIGSTADPFAAITALKVSMRYEVPFIYEVRDLWPQTFIDMGIWKKNDLRSIFFKIIEQVLIRNASGIIVLSPLAEEYIINRYSVDSSLIYHIPNGINPELYNATNQNQEQYFKVMYCGGVDKVHNLDSLIEAAEILTKDKLNEIQIIIVGNGKHKMELLKKADKRKLTNIIWHDPVSKTEVPNILSSADVLFLSTSKVLYGSENKLHEYLAARRPIVVSVYGAHNNPVEKVKCGISVAPNDPGAIADAIIELYRMPKKDREEMAERGREYVERFRSISVLVDKLEDLLTTVNRG